MGGGRKGGRKEGRGVIKKLKLKKRKGKLIEMNRWLSVNSLFSEEEI